MKFRNMINQLPQPYKTSVSLRQTADELGVDIAEIIKLDSGENMFLPRLPIDWQSVADQIALYPDSNCFELRKALAKELSVSEDMIAIGNGSDELIDLLCRLFLEPGKKLLDFPPTFPMFSFFATIMGTQTIEVPRLADFAIDIDEALKRMAETDLVFVANPNNPTGTLTGQADIRRLLKTGKPVVVDEAYFEFCGRTVLPLLSEFPNLIILRTFSKWAGLAGLRVGFMVANPTVIQAILRIKPPYSVNQVAQKAALIALENKATIMPIINKQIEARDWFINQVNKLKEWQAFPSAAACITLVPQQGSAQVIVSQLKQQGIIVKPITMPVLPNAIRIGIGPLPVMQKVLAALSKVKEC